MPNEFFSSLGAIQDVGATGEIILLLLKTLVKMIWELKSIVW